jgi:PiT family inorganic phosphate transporter
MEPTALFVVTAALLLAYSNGANDNFKGVATLFGCGTANFRIALAWATATTLAGSLLALALAGELVEAFTGKGLVPDRVAAEPAFLTAVGTGAGLTVLLATRMGFPISTTHALTGGLVGAGWIATAGHINVDALLSAFVMPLLFSPVLSMLLTLTLYPVFRHLRRAAGVTNQSCICVGASYEPVTVQPNGTLALLRSGVSVEGGKVSECVQRYEGRMWGLEAGAVLNLLHYLSAGAVGFARGLNDTPKIVALLLGGRLLAPRLAMIGVGVMMAVGGVLSARRVAETMSHKITGMNPGQGFTANLVTSILVLLASRFGMPVSTTHVAVGSLFGIGAMTGTARSNVVLTILLAWITTLPLAAGIAAAAYWAQGTR